MPLIKNYVPGLILNVSWSVFLPPNTPPEIAKWHTEQIRRALNTTQARAYFYTNFASINTPATNPAGLIHAIADLQKTWNKVAETMLKEKNNANL